MVVQMAVVSTWHLSPAQQRRDQGQTGKGDEQQIDERSRLAPGVLDRASQFHHPVPAPCTLMPVIQTFALTGRVTTFRLEIAQAAQSLLYLSFFVVAERLAVG